MRQLRHEQARHHLHDGRESLSQAQRTALDQHLAVCAECASYAVELNTRQAALSRLFHARWNEPRPASDLEHRIKTRLEHQHAHKRIFRSARSWLAAPALIILGVMFLSLFQSNGTSVLTPNVWNSGATLVAGILPDSARFPCPTPNPLPLTRLPQPTAAPEATIAPAATHDPNAPRRPTRVRTPRPPRTPKPTPTINFIEPSAQWETYHDPEYGFSFDYPKSWNIQTSREQLGIPNPIVPQDGVRIYITNFTNAAPAGDAPDALSMVVEFSPALCANRTLEEVLDRTRVIVVKPLTPQASVGNHSAFRRTVQFPGLTYPTDVIEVFVPRGKWLYRFRANPANSKYLDAFERLLQSFKTP